MTMKTIAFKTNSAETMKIGKRMSKMEMHVNCYLVIAHNQSSPLTVKHIGISRAHSVFFPQALVKPQINWTAAVDCFEFCNWAIAFNSYPLITAINQHSPTQLTTVSFHVSLTHCKTLSGCVESGKTCSGWQTNFARFSKRLSNITCDGVGGRMQPTAMKTTNRLRFRYYELFIKMSRRNRELNISKSRW